VKFWDSSALLPLLVDEPSGAKLRLLLTQDAQILAWWSSRVEMASALAKREREGSLTAGEADAAYAALQQLAQSWEEVTPSDLIRTTAQRLLRTHPLRAAASLQLAAALIASGREPPELEFVCLDERLGNAARREGFPVVALSAY
jgi:predicted nucleic acid-binding protein